MNIRKYTDLNDQEIYKKLNDTEIWEFRTMVNGKQYRILAFWDKIENTNTLVSATHGFIKKWAKTQLNEISKANLIMKHYFEQKK